MSRERLAQELRCTLRTLERNLKKLIDDGCFTVARKEWKGQLMNVYVPVKRNNTCEASTDEEAPETRQNVVPTAREARQNVAPVPAETRQNVVPMSQEVRQNVTGAISESELKNEIKESSSSAAAAADFEFLTKEKRMPAQALKEISTHDISEIAAHVRELDAKKKPYGIGYLVSCAKRPAEHFFVKTDEGWKRPDEGNAASTGPKGSKTVVATEADRRRIVPEDYGLLALKLKGDPAPTSPRPDAQVERKIDKAAKNKDLKMAAWEALPGEVSRRIQNAVVNAIQSSSLLRHDDLDIKMLCLDEMERLGYGPRGD
jgi:hypothetical protein